MMAEEVGSREGVEGWEYPARHKGSHGPAVGSSCSDMKIGKVTVLDEVAHET